MASWKWLDSKRVEITSDQKAVSVFDLVPISESEWTGFYDRIADLGEVYAILKRARMAFITGSAEYIGARENLANLIREYNGARSEILVLARDVDVFFSRPGLSAEFGRDQNGLVEFVLEFTAKTYVHKATNGE